MLQNQEPAANRKVVLQQLEPAANRSAAVQHLYICALLPRFIRYQRETNFCCLVASLILI